LKKLEGHDGKQRSPLSSHRQMYQQDCLTQDLLVRCYWLVI